MPRITGRQRVTTKLKGMAGEKAVRDVGAALFAGGKAIHADAYVSLQEGGGEFGRHVPSLPGEPPNSQTGHLKSQLEVAQLAPLRVEVSSNAAYSAHLEFGTSKMAARPFMGPATRKNRKEVVALVTKAIDKAIREA